MHAKNRSCTLGYPRLKTARQKRRLLKEDFDKQLIKLYLLQQRLYRQKAALPLIPLAEPYQKGWKRTFILRGDVARSAMGHFYLALLEKINTVDYSRSKSFTQLHKRKRKKVLQVKPQYLREFCDWDHPGIKLKDVEKAHFHKEERWSKDRKTNADKIRV